MTLVKRQASYSYFVNGIEAEILAKYKLVYAYFA